MLTRWRDNSGYVELRFYFPQQTGELDDPGIRLA